VTHKFDLETTLERKDDAARAALGDAWTLVAQARQLGVLMGR